MSDGTPQEPPPQPVGKKPGFPLWIILLCIFALAGTAVWKSGIVDRLSTRGPVNVNTASFDDLKDLPGVDKKIAQDIIEKRPFKDVDDLKRVKGIGDKKLENLRDLVTAGD